MSCYSCYKPTIDHGYCLACRKTLFGGVKVSHILPFDMPKADNLLAYQEKTKRLSISGVQLKYSLRLSGNELVLTDKHGAYLLKPIPPSNQIVQAEQAPENEHLTMQIASKIFGIATASNALIYFNDGTPAYITKRFDVKTDGSKFQQEDMAQLSGRSKSSHGDYFKYEGSYVDIGHLIKQYVNAYIPSLERFFKTIVFNYLFSNGDAHLKNFSLIQTDDGDYTLSKAYDLMSTVIHTPQESDVALDLYKGDIDSDYYSTYGCYGRSNFEELANRLGIMPKRAERIIAEMLKQESMVEQMVMDSFLDDIVKHDYMTNFKGKLSRLLG